MGHNFASLDVCRAVDSFPFDTLPTDPNRAGVVQYSRMSQPLKAAILIVSTTVANGSTTDTAGQTLRSVFEAESLGKWEVVSVQAVSDDVEQIQSQIKKWTDEGADDISLIITTGGTGFAVADQTPEVCIHLLR